MRVKIDEAPQDLRRRAAHRLESIRGTPMGAGADGARLGDEACPIYRPDIKGVAYWEFEIVGLKGTQARDRKGEGNGVGFMLATAGRHDVPLSHWSLGIEPPSRALEAKAADSGKVARVVKLDTLAYAAEDAVGTYLAHVGQFPPLISGIGTDLKKRQGISSVTALPGTASENDDAPAELALSRGGAPVPKLKVTAWRSWADAKRRYAAAYKPHLTALAEHAAAAWEIEDLLAKFGEGIQEGGRLTVPLLKPGKAEVTGDGAKAIRMSRIERPAPAVVLEAAPTDGQKETGFQLEISYEDGTQEVLAFFVVPKGAPSNFRSRLPQN